MSFSNVYSLTPSSPIQPSSQIIAPPSLIETHGLFGLANETGTLCWLNAALKMAAESGLLNNCFAVNLADLTETKIKQRSDSSPRIKENILTDIQETIQKLELFIQDNNSSNENLILSEEQTKTLKDWCTILNLEVLTELLTCEALCVNIFIDVLKEALKTLDQKILLESKCQIEEENCTKQIQTFKDHLPKLENIQKILWVIIQQLRIGQTDAQTMSFLKIGLIDALSNLYRRDLLERQFDSKEFFDLINRSFSTQADCFFTPSSIPMDGETWSLFDNYTPLSNDESIFVYLSRHIEDNHTQRILNNPIHLNTDATIKIESNKSTYAVKSAICYKGSIVGESDSLGHYIYIEERLLDGHLHYFSYSDLEVRELSQTEFVEEAKLATILHFKNITPASNQGELTASGQLQRDFSKMQFSLHQIVPASIEPIHPLDLPNFIDDDFNDENYTKGLLDFPKPEKLLLPTSQQSKILPQRYYEHAWLNACLSFMANTGSSDRYLNLNFKDEETCGLHQFLFAMIQLLRTQDLDNQSFISKAEKLQDLILESLVRLDLIDVIKIPFDFFDELDIAFTEHFSSTPTITPSPDETGFEDLEIESKGPLFLRVDHEEHGYEHAHAKLNVSSDGKIEINGLAYTIKSALILISDCHFFTVERTINNGEEIYLTHDGMEPESSLEEFIKAARTADILYLEPDTVNFLDPSLIELD
jgi:hypothetical protein